MIGAAIVSRFRVEARLGQGGMGEVYRAWDTLLARPVALKWIRHDRRDDASVTGRFLREARTAAGLRHPNIVTIYDLGTEPEGSYLVMELLDGQPLGVAMEDASRPVLEKLGWLRKIGVALAAAHAAGVVHRDIKPSNVMVCRDGHVKVVDFGLAKRFGLAPLTSTSTSTASWTGHGVVVGTPLYMAPEQARGDDADPRVDQFAWGAVGYELVHRVRWTPALRERPCPADAPIDVLAVLRRATQPDPADRFASMIDAVRALEASFGGAPAGPTVPDLPSSTATPTAEVGSAGWSVASTTATRTDIDYPSEMVTFCPLCGHRAAAAGSCPRDRTPLSVAPFGSMLGTQLGNYVAVEEIGAGGMGFVLRAVHPTIGRQVAIKVLHASCAADEGARARLLREAQIVNRIESAGIPEVMDASVLSDGRPYLVMELLVGESLAKRLERTGRFALGEVCRIVLEILRVLEAAHRQSVVHRDLKPENVFLTTDGRVVVLDFGIAKLLDANGDARLTSTGASIGTPAYMAPEQIMGGVVDARTDVYAAGVLLYEVLTGRRPFLGSDFEVLSAHCQQRPAPPRAWFPEIPEELQSIVLTALAKAPEQRFQRAAAMAAALEFVLRQVEARPSR